MSPPGAYDGVAPVVLNEPREKKILGERPPGIATLPHEENAFPAGSRLLSFVF